MLELLSMCNQARLHLWKLGHSALQFSEQNHILLLNLLLGLYQFDMFSGSGSIILQSQVAGLVKHEARGVAVRLPIFDLLHFLDKQIVLVENLRALLNIF